MAAYREDFGDDLVVDYAADGSPLGLEHARREGLAVVPTCQFIASYIDRHPQYQELPGE